SRNIWTLIGSSYSSTATTSPSWTVWPSCTLISLTAPARGASTGISIFIDSSTITASPAATRSPGFVVIWKTTPVMCALISSAIEGSLVDQLRVNSARAELVACHDPPKERDRRLRAFDDARRERPVHPLQRLRARGPVRDQLEEQGIVVHRHGGSSLHAGLDPDSLSGGQLELRQRPRRRQEALRRVLSIHATLDRRAALRNLVLAPR